MMAMQHIVATTPQFLTQSSRKLELIADRDRSMNDSGAKRSRLFIQSTWPLEIAIERPIHRNALRTAKSKHPDEPILHGTLVEILYDMNDLSTHQIWYKKGIHRPSTFCMEED